MNKKFLKNFSILIIISLSLFLVPACDKNEKSEEKSAMALGTVITAKAYGKDAKSALDEAFKRVDEIDKKMSVKSKDSDITKVNEKAYKEEVVLDDDMFFVIKKALYYANISEGAFDPAIGKLIDTWGIGTDNEHVLTEKEKENYKNLYNYKKVILNEEKHTIRFKSDKVKLDLGAIVKGYVADEMKRILVEKYHIKSAMLNLGGNIVAIGGKDKNKNWLVGIQNPTKSDKLSATLEVNDKMVVTSGNYERYFEKDGVRYHHILSPFTAMPADMGIISSTIVTDKSIDADALSTATYVMGIEKSKKMLEKLDGVEAVFISKDMKMEKIKGIDKYNLKEID